MSGPDLPRVRQHLTWPRCTLRWPTTPKAYEEAKWVIDNKGRFGYELEADYQDLFRAEMADNLTEHIFSLDFLGQQNGGGGANDDLMPPMTRNPGCR